MQHTLDHWQRLVESVAQGDVSALAVLCKVLADRMVYLPVSNVLSESEDSLKVTFVRTTFNSSDLVSVISSEKEAKDWTDSGRAVTMVPVLGADLWDAVGRSGGVLLAPDSENPVALTPEILELVTTLGLDCSDCSPSAFCTEAVELKQSSKEVIFLSAAQEVIEDGVKAADPLEWSTIDRE